MATRGEKKRDKTITTAQKGKEETIETIQNDE